jgi:N-carbamoyl-L-amino-acid hydrolase
LAPAVDRIHADWQHLSSFRTDNTPDYTRAAFSPAYRAAREWLAERMRTAGLEPEIDAAGNLVGRRAGTRPSAPSILVGSHTDTVMGGGRFDGIIGVLGGIEVARCLVEAAIKLEHPLEVVDFLAEEPTEFGISTVGSRALSGSLTPDMLSRANAVGTSLGEAIASVGGRPTHIAAVQRAAGSVAQYLELHIEQGPLLERAGVPVGVVTGITGITRFRLCVQGRADHAGTMPMSLRRDALAAASEINLTLEALWQDDAGVGTLGRIAVAPNATNVVPGSTEMWIEMRSVNGHTLAQRSQDFAEQVQIIARRRDVAYELELVSGEEPVPIGHAMQNALGEIIGALNVPIHRLASYAGHDANQMAKIAPIGMVFVPSRAGRSHCAEEWTDLADVALGTRVLGEAVAHLDRTLS